MNTTEAAEGTAEVLALRDERGDWYAIPLSLLAEFRLSEEQRAKLDEHYSDVQGHGALIESVYRAVDSVDQPTRDNYFRVTATALLPGAGPLVAEAMLAGRDAYRAWKSGNTGPAS
jgi:hypothetical protein